MADWTDGQLIGLITIGLGVIGFFGLVEWRRRSLHMQRDGVTTEAEVLSSKKRQGDDGISYRTKVRFVDVTGEDVYTKTSLRVEPSVGDKVKVVYDPGKPKRLLTTELGLWNPDGGLFALGRRWVLVLMFVIPGVLMILFPFGDPICDDPTFRDMTFCVEART